MQNTKKVAGYVPAKKITANKPNAGSDKKKKPDVKRVSSSSECFRRKFKIVYDNKELNIHVESPYYIMRRNKVANSLLEEIQKSNPGSVQMIYTKLDTMRGVLFMDKYSEILDEIKKVLPVSSDKDIQREISYLASRDIILLNIRPEKLTQGYKAKQLAKYINEDNFDRFLMENECYLVDEDSWSQYITSEQIRPTAVYIHSLCINCMIRHGKSPDQEKIKALLQNLDMDF